MKPIRITKYQKWLSKSGNDIELQDYIIKRLVAQMNRDIKQQIERFYNPKPYVFNGYFTGVFNQIV